MFNSVNNILESFHGYYLIGIYTYNNEVSFNLIELTFLNNDLKIKERYQADSFEGLKHYLSKSHPIILHIDGVNVISKALDFEVGYRNNLIFKADAEAFHFCEYKQDNKIYVSVIRKDIVAEYLKEVNDLSKYVINISVGPFIVSNLLRVKKDLSKLHTPFHTIQYSSGKIDAVEEKHHSGIEHDINGELFSEKELPLFASFLAHNFPIEGYTFENDFLKSNIEEQRFKKRFKIAGVASLTIIMLALFIGHFLLKSSASALAEKETVYIMSQETIETLETMRLEKTLKEKIVVSSGINNSNFITKYIADIGNSSPDEIILNSISIFPLQKKIREDEKIKYENNVIIITGETSKDVYFNNWVKQIRNFKWLKDFKTEDYQQESNAVNTFKIKISI